MGDMVKPLGARRKLITKRNMLTCVSTFVAVFKRIQLFFILLQSKQPTGYVHPTTKECIQGDDLNSDDNSEKSYALAVISDDNEDSEPEVYDSHINTPNLSPLMPAASPSDENIKSVAIPGCLYMHDV